MRGHLLGDPRRERVDASPCRRIKEGLDRRARGEPVESILLGTGRLDGVPVGGCEEAGPSAEGGETAIFTWAAVPPDLQTFGEAILKAARREADGLGVAGEQVRALDGRLEILRAGSDERRTQRSIPLLSPSPADDEDGNSGE